MMHDRKIKIGNKPRDKQVIQMANSSDKENPVWCFNNVDNDGDFCLSKDTICADMMIEKILALSKMTWSQIKAATHDNSNKSKNHELDYEGISKEGRDRIKAKKLLDEDIEAIFSIAFTNKIRLIGLKRGSVFHAMWYDLHHKFYPIKR